MPTPITRKTARIAGGIWRIGDATALLFAKLGANVPTNYSSDASAADEMLKTIGDENAFAIKGDAGSLPHFKRMVSKTEACQENRRLNPMRRFSIDEESQRHYGAGL